ncbi:MAG: cation-translocating P-type ATPase [Candidatus Izemoplasmatales bacterium]|nr:cation-translocating P-type ATPase [Candidatus Izemoplasmatales bacterium]
MKEFQSYKGLTSEEAKRLQIEFGKNELTVKKKESFFHKIIDVLKEPMFLLLIVAATIYFFLGEPRDGAIMLVFVVGIISIEIIQEWKTDRTLKALKDLSAPQIFVIRDGKEVKIASIDLVVGDLMLVQEGVKIPADGFVVETNGVCVDESTLTGEAQGVWKVVKDSPSANSTTFFRNDYCYAGTLVMQGVAKIIVDKIGSNTEYGKIGTNIASTVTEQTPLQKQTGKLVKFCAIIALFLFVTVVIITYFNIPDHIFSDRIIESILSGITLAMAMIPEEFPVILTIFLSMGAWRLAKKNSLIRRLPSVETLGSVSVLCVDKTGTLTMNQMTVSGEWLLEKKETGLSKTLSMACEQNTFDPMEKSMLEYAKSQSVDVEELFKNKILKAFPFTNENKMMGNVYKLEGKTTLAVKGSYEKITKLCNLTTEQFAKIEQEVVNLSKEGLRVIAVAEQEITDEIPDNLNDAKLSFVGIVSLVDPERESVKSDIERCYQAGIRVVMITGDNGVTASAIARKVGIRNSEQVITGDELSKMGDKELSEKIKTINIYSRVIPEHKMRIVKSLKDIGETVAMTGDGVNDASALKLADIGISMGKRGSEVSREASDLILLDDNFSTIVETIHDGRRIYDNIQKAVGYVFSIHIPIALAALIAPLLGINPLALLLLPLHVVLLELIIDPTCSIVLERQPAESNIMTRGPRDKNEKLLTSKTLIKSIIQGLALFAGSFSVYYFTLQSGIAPEIARSMGLATIILSNLFLVFVNSSNVDYAFQTFRTLIKDRVMWIITFVTVSGLLLILYTPIHTFLKLSPLSGIQLILVFCVAFVSVIWYEVVKIYQKSIIKNKKLKKQINK